jgi:hypothetical protein
VVMSVTRQDFQPVFEAWRARAESP